MYIKLRVCILYIHVILKITYKLASRYGCIGHIEEIDTRVFHKRADFV
jgi:hypothetical protein